ncbi:hypothetical protein D0T23_19745 [Duganella sp. BJB475]|nr:hypothetical protein D0T23_19745 [Duganella sp. BJB475]
MVHYSCESFYDNAGGGSKRVTSIAVRNLNSAQTKSWSIHKSAELLGFLDVISEHLDELEFHMLNGYFEFLRLHHDCTFVHWNMRDENYGFAALEHRFRVLAGEPFTLSDERKVDLARVLVNLYSRSYASHTSPSGKKGRIMSIMEVNKIADLDALQGNEEAEAFVHGEYLKLHRSTLRKVDVFANLFDRVHAKTLKTQAGFLDIYGVHPTALFQAAKDHWILSLIAVLSGLTSAVLNFSRLAAWFK